MVLEHGPASPAPTTRVEGYESRAVAARAPASIAHRSEPNYSLPWTMRHQSSSTSSGFLIGGKRILTNAHCVEDYTVVKVKKRGSATKYVAEVLAIGRECDLALLAVEDDDFWRGITPLQLADRLPTLQDEVVRDASRYALA